MFHVHVHETLLLLGLPVKINGKLDQQKRKHLLSDLFDESLLAPTSSISSSIENRDLDADDEESSWLPPFSKSLLPDFLTGLGERVNNDLLSRLLALLSGVDFVAAPTGFCVAVLSLHIFLLNLSWEDMFDQWCFFERKNQICRERKQKKLAPTISSGYFLIKSHGLCRHYNFTMFAS